MATKKLKALNIYLIGCGNDGPIDAIDTLTDPQATYALDAFKAEKHMRISYENGATYIPFHAVDYISIEENETEVADKPTPYGCCPDGTAGGSVVGC